MKEFKLSIESLGEIVQFLTGLLKSEQSYKVVISEWSSKRSLSANAQQHVWYKQIADFTGLNIREAGNSQKLDFGLPILLEDVRYQHKVDYVLKKIDFFDMTREQQINVMDLIQVTSLFNSKQHSLYRDNMIHFWQQQGLMLEYR